MSAPNPQGETIRLDKWLWFTRFFKSRSIAGQVCKAGKVRVSGTKVTKPSHALRVGDVLTFPAGNQLHVVRVLALGERRGPATEARTLFEQVEEPQRLAPPPDAKPPGARRPKGAGRPTKRERRQMDQLKDS
ncbi:heat shock protein Hsp15 [Limimonas halophila]|uniref:Heat shock protein Hsp15 n=1 Tax=Limimonas halophila TaxID=1082479 RepID=A0A1G7LII2_9PROT|nr:RNA-binding S4 domain-containing protein [Limimonas halophila]SDF48759.1 heat shock protein Hsp15 [Limimonas halophila]